MSSAKDTLGISDPSALLVKSDEEGGNVVGKAVVGPGIDGGNPVVLERVED